MIRVLIRYSVYIWLLCITAAGVAHAQQLPGSVDPGRIQNEQSLEQSKRQSTAKPALEFDKSAQATAPEGAEELLFTLNSVTIEGVNAFKKTRFEALHRDKIGTEVSAALLWELAGSISKAYKDEGYFLSRAYVPEQTVDTGDIRIKVIEGYIGDVEIVGENQHDHFVQEIISDIIAQKPIKAKYLESQLLRLNDLHGINFKAILSSSEILPEGAVTLKLQQDERTLSPQATLAAHNYGSRFIGPYRGGITLEHSLIDYHKTTLSIQAALPNANDELLLGSLAHRIQITPSVELDFLLSTTKSTPGFTLKDSEVESDSFSWGIRASWRPIRQRNKNLTLSARLDSLNSNTDTFGTPLTRDRIRTFRMSATYDFIDKFKGANFISLTASKGLGILGASDEEDLNLSRADASSDFTKLDAYYNRQDYLGNSLFLNTSLSGQWASRSLFSSEEFGYGGQSFGRAYDFSEITGDHGIAASLELSYAGIKPIKNYQINPYLFYDIGKVWNKGNAAVDQVSATSAGFGTKIYNNDGFTFDAALAFPLTKPIDTPIQGGNGKKPVFRFSLTKAF